MVRTFDGETLFKLANFAAFVVFYRWTPGLGLVTKLVTRQSREKGGTHSRRGALWWKWRLRWHSRRCRCSRRPCHCQTPRPWTWGSGCGWRCGPACLCRTPTALQSPWGSPLCSDTAHSSPSSSALAILSVSRLSEGQLKHHNPNFIPQLSQISQLGQNYLLS